jgi:hypothetical protein
MRVVFKRHGSVFLLLGGSQALPPNSSSRAANGWAYLDPNFTFNAGILIANYDGITAVSLFRSTSASDLGKKLFDLPPGPVAVGIGSSGWGQYFGTDVDKTLTPIEAGDLRSGLWWITVITPEFPNGEIRGQLSAVPEPSTFELVGFGATAFLILKRRNSGSRRRVRFCAS